MNPPLVSVIIAVKNGERFLTAAIHSILAQDYHPYEIIVVDGHSTDTAAAIARSFPSVRSILQVNHGVADAYNTGIDAARGAYLAFLSHDDLWTPNKLSVQMGYMLDHPDIQYTVARVKFFLEPGCAIPPGFRKALLEGDHVGHIMETFVARRTVFDRIGRFNTGLTTAEDVEWFARASDYRVPMAVLPGVLVYKRVHDANISLTPANDQNLLRALKLSIDRKRRSR